MATDLAKHHLATLKLQAEQHEVIRDSDFQTTEEYVLHLMHRADYEKAALLAAGKTVLDLGCNGGHGTHILGKTCKHITGVDVSPVAIAAATAKHASETVEFLLVDGVSLPFPAHSFDVVTSFQVIEHLADYASYLGEIRRVLRSDGLLLITTPNAAIRVHPGQKPWNPFHVREFRASELGELLRSHFPFTAIVGQFASERTYAVEYTRCIHARGSLPVKRALVTRVARRLWREGAGLYGAVKRRLVGHPAEDFRAAHSLEDFYYQEAADLDRSLSLVACCSSDEPTASNAAKGFVSVW